MRLYEGVSLDGTPLRKRVAAMIQGSMSSSSAGKSLRLRGAGEQPRHRRDQVRRGRDHRQLGHAQRGGAFPGRFHQPAAAALRHQTRRETARRAPPFGYGRELYFWAFIVALLVLALGAGVSVYEGITHSAASRTDRQPLVNYIVLAAALLFEGTSWLIALRAFRASKGSMAFSMRSAAARTRPLSPCCSRTRRPARPADRLDGVHGRQVRSSPRWTASPRSRSAWCCSHPRCCSRGRPRVCSSANPRRRKPCATTSCASPPPTRMSSGERRAHRSTRPAPDRRRTERRVRDELTTPQSSTASTASSCHQARAYPMSVLFVKPQSAETGDIAPWG